MIQTKYFVLFQTEDYIDDLLNGESYADSLKYDANTMSDIRIKEEPQAFSELDAKDRQKKDNHNMSEFSGSCFGSIMNLTLFSFFQLKDDGGLISTIESRSWARCCLKITNRITKSCVTFDPTKAQS